MKRFSLREKIKARFGVGMKVAMTVIMFEVIIVAAYAILTQFFFDGGEFVARVLDIEQAQAIAVLLIASLVLSGYLTFLVVVQIFTPVSDLIRGTEEIIKGNLDLKLETKTGDELEVLAERFNVMAAELKKEREGLEAKVRERTRALEDAQKKELVKQKEILRLKDEFLFVAAHELRTPVTSIRWSLESAKDMKRMPKEARDFLRDATNSSKNLEALVSELLNMARLDAKGISFKEERVDVRKVVHAVKKEMLSLAEEKGIEIVSGVPEEGDILALADERRLREVLVNLIGNSIKYNDKGGHVWVRAQADDDHVRLDVEDDGPGISGEDQKHLFEKFWRSKENEGVEGSGLGLFITKRLVEGMNGSISFESEKGKGTTFSVDLRKAE